MTQLRASLTKTEEIINVKKALDFFDLKQDGILNLDFRYKDELKASIIIDSSKSGKCVYVLYSVTGSVFQCPCTYNKVGTNIYLTINRNNVIETFKIQLSELVVNKY